MGFKSKIVGLDENQIKKFVKVSILNGYSKKILKSKSIKKSVYLRDLVEEATIELQDFMDFIENNVECPEEKLKYLINHLK
jgi:hypothetical protein